MVDNPIRPVQIDAQALLGFVNRRFRHVNSLTRRVDIVESPAHLQTDGIGGHFPGGRQFLLHGLLMRKLSFFRSAVEEVKLDFNSSQPVVSPPPPRQVSDRPLPNQQMR